jgi:hypothetical protein
MPNRKVVMEESKQDKMNTLIAKEVDKVIDLSKSQTKVILNNSDRITDINKTIKFILGIQLATLIVVTLVHAQHSGWFDNIGWLQ